MGGSAVAVLWGWGVFRRLDRILGGMIDETSRILFFVLVFTISSCLMTYSPVEMCPTLDPYFIRWLMIPSRWHFMQPGKDIPGAYSVTAMGRRHRISVVGHGVARLTDLWSYVAMYLRYVLERRVKDRYDTDSTEWGIRHKFATPVRYLFDPL